VRALSEPTRSLIDEVHQLAGRQRVLPWRKTAVESRIVACLERIEASREWRAIPWIISLTLHERRRVSAAAAEAVRSLASQVPPQDLGKLDQSFRELSPYLHGSLAPWYFMKPQDLRRAPALEVGPTLLQLAMCHPSGYVRQEAIRRAATTSDGSEIPLLLLRSNDWVAPVRKAAQDALRARLRPANLPEIVSSLPILEQMRRWQRLEDHRLVADIEELLQTAAAAEHLLAGLASRDRFRRRASFRRALRSAHIPDEQVFARALDDADPAVRGWASRELCDADGAAFFDFAPRLLADRLGAIRFRAIRRLHVLGQTVSWQDFLFDAHPGVRGIAQHQARKAGADVAHVYRQHLADPSPARLAGALLGLGETGIPDDIVRLRAFLDHGSPRARRSALRALAKLGDTDVTSHCLAALSDPRPSVTHAARDLLVAGIGRVTPAQLWHAFECARKAHGKKDVLAVLATRDYWERLPYQLRATTVADDEVRQLALSHVAGWVARHVRVFTTPRPATTQAIRDELARARLAERVRAEVLAILESRTPI
jgi:HEAT repeat protein